MPVAALALATIICSRMLFLLSNDPEGPNLLVVGVGAAIIYFPSLIGYAYAPSRSNLGRFSLAILIQALATISLYLLVHYI
jgi:hypothetical protein